MKKINKILIGICIAAIAVFMAAGCSADEQDKTGPAAVSYLIAPTANSQGLNLNTPLLQDMAYDTILNYGYISVITVDGNPEVVHAASYDIDEQYKNASKGKLKTDARAKTTNLITAMQNEVANDAEVDYLEGLRLGVRSMASLEGYESKTIVVIGTGLSSTGKMNFQNNLLSVDAKTVVDALEKKKEIPDFTGINIVWQQMGDVAAPQQELSQSQRVRLQEIWGELVERGNGSFVYNEIMANPVNESIEYPKVSVVPLPAEPPVSFDANVLETSALEKPVVLSEKQVAFVGDTAEYLYPDEVMKTINPIAEYLIKHEEETEAILLAGTAAGDETNNYTLRLSEDRANAVKNTLIQLGVDETRILTVGLGASDPWHIPGVGVEGSDAAKNRKVVLMDASSDIARQIWDKKKH